MLRRQLPAPIYELALRFDKQKKAEPFNACSMRAYEMEPKAQCSRRRRACTCMDNFFRVWVN